MKKLLISSNLCYDHYKNINIDTKQDLNNYLINNNYLPIYYYSKNINYNLLAKCDGLILSGTGNINQLEKNKLNLLRDNFEIKLFKYFKKKKRPILAVCRGFQLISSLKKSKLIKVKNHVRKMHKIYLNSRKEILLKKNLFVNSYHDYGIKTFNSQNYDLTAVSKDKFVELAYSKKDKFLGIMFHPERYNASQIIINKTLKKFFK